MSHYHWDDLTNNNDWPTNNTILVVKELLPVPLKQLEDLNLELKKSESKSRN